MIDITGREPIYEAQRFLRALHYDTKGAIPHIVPDGIYGAETTEVVKSFQRLSGLPVTGQIDFETWTRLYEDYRKALERQGNPEPLNVFPKNADYVTTRGEISDAVAIIQFVLRTLSDFYDGISGAPPSGVYDEATMRDIRHFQKIHRLPETGYVDRATWNELAKAYNRSQKVMN